MTHISFKNDYSNGAHPQVLDSLIKNNTVSTQTYGDDQYTHLAAQLIKGKFNCPNAEVRFVTTGTLANIIMISTFLKPFESVIAASTGHINIHEAGAIEATGHKIDTITALDGKLTPLLITEVLNRFQGHHTAKPKLVYISQSTELGTTYTLNELLQIKHTCTKHKLYLVLDGARLGNAIAAKETNLKYEDIGKLFDAFYIGGAKNGALTGEAIVLNNPKFNDDFVFHVKQRGGLIAKSRFLGVQFVSLFENELYHELASHSNKMAAILTEDLKNKGFQFLVESNTNQIFPILPNSLVTDLREKFDFLSWKIINNEYTAIRLVTTWTTTMDEVLLFTKTLQDFDVCKSI